MLLIILPDNICRLVAMFDILNKMFVCFGNLYKLKCVVVFFSNHLHVGW